MTKQRKWHFVTGEGSSANARVAALCGARVNGAFPIVFDNVALWRHVRALGQDTCANCARRVERASELMRKLVDDGPMVLK